MSRASYAAELEELQESERYLASALKQHARIEIVAQLMFRLASAERAAARAVLMFRPEGVH